MGLLDPPALTKAAADSAYAPASAAPPIAATNPPMVLPRVTIDTAAAAPVADKVNYIDATMTINGPVPYSGTLQIRGRGNSTWDAPKKPYRLKLTAAAALLGMPAERDWVLLANYYDPLSIRTALAFEVGARCTGLAWTPRMRFVEVVLNGVFLGLYQLGEHVEISAQKINVTKATGTTGLALTGAYSMEIDQRLESEGNHGFRTTRMNIPIAMDDPDDTIPAHKTYIQGWINTFEAALYGPTWLDPTTGYAQYIDMPSFVDWYLVNELAHNYDSGFAQSCKLYKTRDTADTPGRLVMGPLWDFDNSFNNLLGGPTNASEWWTRVPVSVDPPKPGALWINRMLGDPVFVAMLRARWALLRTALLSGDSVGAVVDRLVDRLTFAAARDQRTWSYTSNNPVSGDTLKAWIKTRMNWLGAQLAPESTPPTVPGSLTVVAASGQATVSWAASTDNVLVTKYRLRRDGAVIAEPIGLSYVDTGLVNGTPRSYTVSAVDLSGNESAQTAAVSTTPTADTTAPTISSFTATPGAAQVALAWTGTDNVGITRWVLTRGGTTIHDGTATNFTDTGRTNGTAYTYALTAYDAAGNASAASSATATPVAATAADPTTVAGLAAWWKADSISGADGDPVGTWSDSGTGGKNLTASGTARPTLKTSIVNSKPVLRFDGTDDGLEVADIGATTAATTFAVLRPTSAGGTIRGGAGGGQLQLRVSGGKLNLVKQSQADLGSGGTTLSTSAFSVVALTVAQSSAGAFYVNGAVDGTASADGSINPGSTLRVGRAAGEYFTGDIAEVIVYNAVLSAQDRASVTAYLGQKYGITVS